MVEIPEDIGRVLEPALEDDPGRLATVARSGAYTYADLDREANRWARALLEHGVGRGDRVAVSLPNDLPIVAAFHGAMRIGAVWVGINQALAPPEAAYMLGQSMATAILCEQHAAEALRSGGEAPADLRTLVVQGEGGDAWQRALKAQDASPVDISVDPLAPAGIAYTSGTTGYPKGAMHSQRNLLMPGAYLIATRGFDSSLRKGDCLPMTILNLMVLTTLLASQAKGLSVIMDRVSSDSVREWVRDQKVTVWDGPPPTLYSLAHDDGVLPAELASLREVWCGGADCPAAVRDAFERKFDAEVRSIYGLTEAPTVVSIEPPGIAHVEGSSGRPLPHLEVTIRDPEGESVAPGTVGEICIGPRPAAEIEKRMRTDWGKETDSGGLPAYSTMLGYWDRPVESATALAGGFFRTGDAGKLDAEGNLIVSDRISLVVNRGGANVYPAEVERIAMSFPSVNACGVFGVPDDRLGERVGMLVEFDAGDEDLDGLVAYCLDRLAGYKVPELVAAVDEVPRNTVRKIDRRKLGELGVSLVAGGERRSHR